METVQTSAPAQQGNTTPAQYYTAVIQCSIRRKPNMTAIPGQDPNERSYKIGAALDVQTRGNLKGISGALEDKFMPEIVGVSLTDPTYRKSIDTYWASISRTVPADEVYLKDEEKGIKFNISFSILGKPRKERFMALASVQEKMEFLNTELLNTGTDGRPVIILDHSQVSDFLLLNYCLRYPRVANDANSIHKSVKIEFYIFDKAVSVKTQLSAIDADRKAMALYTDIAEDSKKIDAILLGFNVNPKEYTEDVDKLLKIYETYKTNLSLTMKFIDLASDELWEVKAIINKAITENKLKKMPNTEAIYYNDTLLGMNLNDTAIYLRDDIKGMEIKSVLIKELNIS